ncbi:hypothetical protein D5F01_LYC07189 [Larimichthys crocea]|uniref:Uncharacterized protein n=1 Tax=Larimichthys crocea TaxID=215358 RepID=A0A6G0IRU8_LARCR|nr:L-selectin [Larimichthys crocea]KAE8294239.1 hypothetical protein D5F01_LYC07189 [Larimichthys crocea]
MKWTLILLLGSSLAETALGWTFHRSEYKMNWTQARQWCQKEYTDIVVMRDQKENDHLVSKLKVRNRSPYYWIGITKKDENGTWTWIKNMSTWISEHPWAVGEPSKNSTDFCVEIYANTGSNRGKWNDEDCSNSKFAACYKAQCNATSCGQGRCQEIIENITCHCDPGFKGDRCQTAVGCPPLSQPDNGSLSCSEGNYTFNSTCRYKCHSGFLMIGFSTVTCGAKGAWSGPRPACASYKQALAAIAGCGALSAFCCICFCWMKHKKRKKLAQVREPEEVRSPSSEAQG